MATTTYRPARFPAELDAKLEAAAAETGETVSDFIRTAVAQRADAVLGVRNRDVLADVIGSVASGAPSVAHRTGAAFTELLAERPRTGSGRAGNSAKAGKSGTAGGAAKAGNARR